jgi:hypothetical protein
MNNDIHEAAKKRDWEDCKQALFEQLIQIEQHRAATICLAYFENYMSKLLDTAENGNWLTNRLTNIRESKLFSEKGNDLPPFPDMNVKFTDAKLRTTKWALFYFWSGARLYADTQLRASKLTEAIASMITVFRHEHPNWIPPQYDTEDVRIIDSQEYGEFLWIKLADILN